MAACLFDIVCVVSLICYYVICVLEIDLHHTYLSVFKIKPRFTLVNLPLPGSACLRFYPQFSALCLQPIICLIPAPLPQPLIDCG